jgi:hypothetical protein
MHCHAVVYFLVYKVIELMKCTIFLTDGVSGVRNFKYVFWIFVSCLWSDQPKFMALFMVFNLWSGPRFYF